MDLPDGLTEPNDGAYTKTETRHGPPLEYVAEKLHSCLLSLHCLHREEQAGIREAPMNSSFRYALVSYLALNNLLAIANDRDLSDRLLSMGREDFENWLGKIRDEGSVT